MGSYPLLSQAPTQVEVELGCDNVEDMELIPFWTKTHVREEKPNSVLSYILFILIMLKEHYFGQIMAFLSCERAR